MANKAAIILACTLLSACAGGGGSEYVAPQAIQIGQSTPLTLELTAWGAGSGKLSARYTNIQCHYKVATSAAYVSMPMTRVSESPDRLTVRCVIPPLVAKPGDTLEYYFDFKFDGVYSQRIEKPVPFQ